VAGLSLVHVLVARISRLPGSLVRSAKAKQRLPYIILLVALAIFAVYVGKNLDRYQQLLDLSLGRLSLLITLGLCTIVGLGLINYLFLRALATPVSVNEAVGLAAVTSLANQLPFAGGIVAKSVYLKRRHGLKYTDFFSGSVALSLLFVSADGVLGLAALSYQGLRLGTMPSPLLILAFSLMLIGALGLFIRSAPTFVPDGWRSRMDVLLNGRRLLLRDIKSVAGLGSMGRAAVALQLAASSGSSGRHTWRIPTPSRKTPAISSGGTASRSPTVSRMIPCSMAPFVTFRLGSHNLSGLHPKSRLQPAVPGGQHLVGSRSLQQAADLPAPADLRLLSLPHQPADNGSGHGLCRLPGLYPLQPGIDLFDFGRGRAAALVHVPLLAGVAQLPDDGIVQNEQPL
jgi:hypothetical protein